MFKPTNFMSKFLLKLCFTGDRPLIKTCEKFDKLWNQNMTYQYNISKGSFCSDGPRGPYWFECNEEILPNVTFVHNRNEICFVDMDKGQADKSNEECLNNITDILKSGKQFHLLWLVHGFLSSPITDGFQKLQESYVKNYQTKDNDMLIIAVVHWNREHLGKHYY